MGFRRDRDGERPQKCIERMVAAETGEIERLEPAAARFCRSGTPEETLPLCAPQHREHQIAPCIHVVDGHQQFTKPGLPEIVRQELDVLATELGRRRRGNRRRAPNQVPQLRQRPLDDGRSAQRRSDQPPHRPVLRSPLRPRAQRCGEDAPGQRGDADEQGKEDEPRDDGGERRRGKERVDPGAETRTQQRSRALQPDQREKEPDGADRDGENEERKRHGEDDASGHERPPGSAERRAPSVEAGRGPRSPDPVGVPQLGASVHRGEEGANGAGAAAGDEVDLEPGFVEGAEHTGMVRSRRSRAGQDDGGAQPRRVRAVRRVRSHHE